MLHSQIRQTLSAQVGEGRVYDSFWSNINKREPTVNEGRRASGFNQCRKIFENMRLKPQRRTWIFVFGLQISEASLLNPNRHAVWLTVQQLLETGGQDL